MASAKVYSADGAEKETIDLSAAVFDIEPNVALVHQVATTLQANQRQGNAETKVRKEVRGGGRGSGGKVRAHHLVLSSPPSRSFSIVLRQER